MESENMEKEKDRNKKKTKTKKIHKNSWLMWLKKAEKM